MAFFRTFCCLALLLVTDAVKYKKERQNDERNKLFLSKHEAERYILPVKQREMSFSPSSHQSHITTIILLGIGNSQQNSNSDRFGTFAKEDYDYNENSLHGYTPIDYDSNVQKLKEYEYMAPVYPEHSENYKIKEYGTPARRFYKIPDFNYNVRSDRFKDALKKSYDTEYFYGPSRKNRMLHEFPPIESTLDNSMYDIVWNKSYRKKRETGNFKPKNTAAKQSSSARGSRSFDRLKINYQSLPKMMTDSVRNKLLERRNNRNQESRLTHYDEEKKQTYEGPYIMTQLFGPPYEIGYIRSPIPDKHVYQDYIQFMKSSLSKTDKRGEYSSDKYANTPEPQKSSSKGSSYGESYADSRYVSDYDAPVYTESPKLEKDSYVEASSESYRRDQDDSAYPSSLRRTYGPPVYTPKKIGDTKYEQTDTYKLESYAKEKSPKYEQNSYEVNKATYKGKNEPNYSDNENYKDSYENYNQEKEENYEESVYPKDDGKTKSQKAQYKYEEPAKKNLNYEQLDEAKDYGNERNGYLPSNEKHAVPYTGWSSSKSEENYEDKKVTEDPYERKEAHSTVEKYSSKNKPYDSKNSYDVYKEDKAYIVPKDDYTQTAYKSDAYKEDKAYIVPKDDYTQTSYESDVYKEDKAYILPKDDYTQTAYKSDGYEQKKNTAVKPNSYQKDTEPSAYDSNSYDERKTYKDEYDTTTSYIDETKYESYSSDSYGEPKKYSTEYEEPKTYTEKNDEPYITPDSSYETKAYDTESYGIKKKYPVIIGRYQVTSSDAFLPTKVNTKESDHKKEDEYVVYYLPYGQPLPVPIQKRSLDTDADLLIAESRIRGNSVFRSPLYTRSVSKFGLPGYHPINNIESLTENGDIINT
ncbi:uncharacterized protein LOC136033290 isoform X2 [Artemia franciscana]|uniref:Adhesive plaque matrix protein-like n=1 Tax=Artemia franciscana TaxID=6661 RepID=A0AA88LMJ0_ARTSF|nr:hypothetical protein QYM36_008440 [Artemia franciscana]